jgi:hypothetical protein
MYDRALEARKKILDLDHLSTLLTLSNLGAVFAVQGRFSEAEAISLESLEGKKKVLDIELPPTLDAVRNIGVLLKDQGR